MEEVKKEWSRTKDRDYDKKLKAEERTARSQAWREEMKGRGLDIDDSDMFETVELAGRKKVCNL